MVRNGFTLVEVMIALLLAALGAGIAAGIMASSTETVERLTRRSEDVARERGGVLWLEEALLASDVRTAPGWQFSGLADSLAFRSSLRVPDGWVESTSVLVLYRRGRLVLRTDYLEQTLGDSLSSATLDYLGQYGAASPWLSQWESATDAPFAVRLRRTLTSGLQDTLLFYVGRGA